MGETIPHHLAGTRKPGQEAHPHRMAGGCLWSAGKTNTGRQYLATYYGRAQWLIGASPGCLPGGGGQTFKSRYVWIVWVWVSASGLERAWPMGAAAVPGLARGEGRDERAPRRWVRQPFP